MVTPWERIKRGMDEGFDAAITAVHNITEKAGESIEMTRLRREKARYETRLTRSLAELGNMVFERLSKERNDELAENLGVADKLKEVAQEEAHIVDIDKKLSKEAAAEK
jgi:Na+/phosphate symporter